MPRSIHDLPDATTRTPEISERLAGREPAVFLDYDGTLTPIVDRAEDATLPAATRTTIEALRDRLPVAVVSGRDLDDVRTMVDIAGIAYAGSHGMDIVLPSGRAEQRGTEYLPSLDAAEKELAARLDGIAGARLERKRFALAIHHRQVAPDRVGDVTAAVREVAAAHGDLRLTGGKMIHELRPDMDWHKGRALEWLLATLGLDRDDVVAIYVGDDVTDEDAFRTVRDDGLGLVVRGEDDARTTAAHYRLADTEEVRVFLDQLATSVPDRKS